MEWTFGGLERWLTPALLLKGENREKSSEINTMPSNETRNRRWETANDCLLSVELFPVNNIRPARCFLGLVDNEAIENVYLPIGHSLNIR